MKQAAKRIAAAELGILMLILLQSSPVSALTARPAALEEMVGEAGLVVTGNVVDETSRWSDDGRYIVTDYAVEWDEILLDRASRVPRGGRFLTVTLWGGTVGETSDVLVGMPRPVVGRRVLLLLQPGKSIDVMAGGPLGCITLRQDVDGASLDTEAGSLGIAIELHAGRSYLHARPGGGISADKLLELVRGEVARAGGASSTEKPRSVLVAADGTEHNLPTGVPELGPSAGAGQPSIQAVTPASPGREASSTPPDIADEMPNRSSEEDPAFDRPSEALNRSAGYIVSHSASLPIVINQFPASFTPWSPEDQYAMSYWNQHADVFRVFSTPTGTYGWGNGRWDLAGWPSSADLQRVYGQSWSSNTLAVTFWRLSGTRIVEADMCFNPAFRWTLDDQAVLLGSTDAAFHQTILHELGHMWGADHNFSTLSILNYFPGWARAYPFIFADDSAGIRHTYPSVAQSRVDMAGYLFYASGTQSVTEIGYPSSVRAGSTFQVSKVTAENPGSLSKAPSARFYLTTQRNWSGANYGVGSIPGSTLGAGGSSLLSASLRVPPSTPAGSYLLGLYLVPADGSSDSIGINNSMWTRGHVSVSPEASITSVKLLRSPLRLVVSGDGFQPGASIKINGSAVPTTLFKSGTRLIAKGGTSLAGMLPKNQAVSVRVDLPDGGTSDVDAFVRH